MKQDQRTLNSLFRLVKAIHQALTEKTQKLVLRIEQRASSNEVISDFICRLDASDNDYRELKVLDMIVGEFMEQMRDGSLIDLSTQSVATT
jgi:hypothetical protein